MKILLVNDYAETIGGAEVYIKELQEQLTKRGHVVSLYTCDVQRKDITSKKSPAKLASLLFNLHHLIQFRKKLRSFKPNIVHIHGIFNEISPSILFLLRNTPTIMTVHNNQLYSPVSIQSSRTGKPCRQKICRGCYNCVGLFGSCYEFVKRKLQKPLYNYVDIFLGCSKYINRNLEELKIGQTKYVPFGVRLFSYKPLTTRNTLAYIGRLSREKGVQFILNALPEVKKSFPEVKLSIVGDGDYKSELLNIVKTLHLENNVDFLGSKTRSEIERILYNSTISILPSIWDEPFGIVGIESLSAGRPVIASKIGGIDEWLHDSKNGLFFEAGNSNDIAKKITTLLSDNETINKMSRESRKSVLGYSFSTHISLLEKVYQKTVSRYRI